MNAKHILDNTKDALLDRSNEEKIILVGLSVLAAIGAYTAVSKGLGALPAKKKPVQTSLLDADLREDTMWTIGTSVAVGLGGLLLRRGLGRISGFRL